MQKRNISDIIESYLKDVLRDASDVEIRRSEIANRFECVPSQINYVINTRFTPKQGYAVESKRGGGGYIRIMKLQVVDEAEYLDRIILMIQDSISLRDANAIIENMVHEQLIDEKQAFIMRAAVDDAIVQSIDKPNQARAIILKHIVERLKYR
ncbi:MAG: CtsR family transcriptional regulator [Aerococcus sp.]|nr:CtsR family transcriptional regulator [Aerococcus sp.]